LFPGLGVGLAVCIVLLVLGGTAVGMAVVRHALHDNLGVAGAFAISIGIVGLIGVGLFAGTGVGARTARCPECGGYTTSSAGACPACGRFLPGHLVFKGLVFAALALGLSAVLFLASDVVLYMGGAFIRAAEHDARLGHRLAVQEEERKAREASKTESVADAREDPPSYPTEAEDEEE
jgi:hypothetical protein